ncbi:pilus assembly protein [bacterium]|nr:pilus assembly protein [bacterium]
MIPTPILDAGPLIALLDKRDKYYSWALGELSNHPATITCEAVLTEVVYRIRGHRPAFDSITSLIAKGLIRCTFNFQPNSSYVLDAMKTYENVPMDFADACLMAMSEQNPDSPIITIDGDFRIYRRNNGSIPSLIVPPGV